MNPQRSLYGRMTINGRRTDLGFATLSQLFLRAAQTYGAARSSSQELNIILEMSGNKLPDSSILSREQILEQSLAASMMDDPDEESPFPGITVGRVQEVMMTPEYEQYAHYCVPTNREGIGFDAIERAKFAYHEKFPDCSPHFPKWIDS